MAADDFIPPVVPGTQSLTRRTPVRRTEFGDGYTERLVPGLNAVRLVYQLDWPVLTAADADTITAYLEGQLASAFLYTVPPTSDQYKYTVVEDSIRSAVAYDSPLASSVSVKIQQEFDL